jgi:hypothetical protein
MSRAWLFALLTLSACPSASVANRDSGLPPEPVEAAADDTDTLERPTRPLSPPPEPAVDPRTPAQVQQAACMAADGSWRCKHVKRLFAAGATPVLPPGWSIPSWFFDPSNITTAASDGNDCVSAATPCLTFQEVNVHRWGCLGNPTRCPRLTNGLLNVLTFLSDHPDPTDPVAIHLSMEQGSGFEITAPLGAAQTVCAGGTLGSFTAKNQPTAQLYQAQVVGCTSGTGCAAGVCTLAADRLVADATGAHVSRFWTYRNVSGGASGIWSFSQPTAPLPVPPFEFGAPAPVAIASGDAVTVYQPVGVNMVDLQPIDTDANAGFSNYEMYVYQVHGLSFGVTSSVTTGLHVAWGESSEDRWIEVHDDGWKALSQAGWWNFDATQHVVLSASYGNPAIAIEAGIMPRIFWGSLYLDGDVIVAMVDDMSGWELGHGGPGSGVYLQGGMRVSSRNVLALGTVWGPGSLNVAGDARVTYPPGAGGAAATFLQLGGLALNSQTKGCSLVPGVSAGFGPCNLPVTVATLDAIAGPASACLTSGASICNFGP